VRVAAFDVATAVDGDRVALTNGPWDFSITQTRDALGLERLHIINDFTALALAVPLLDGSETRQVGGGSSRPGSAIGVIGAGTGLGVSGLLPDRGRWIAINGEGGHVAFSPESEREDAILQVLRKRFGSHVSVERLLSGMGLTNIFKALCEIDGAEPVHRDPDEITDQALNGRDERSTETVDIFCAALGTAAGNLAMTLGARGGIYIGGGIIPRLGRYFDDSPFRSRFEDKGRFQDYAAAIPTYVILAEQPALRGLAALLKHAD
jgi:glucokinase